MNYNNYFHKKNILITGGFGFIGSNLALKLINLGAYVTILDNMFPGYGANKFNIPENSSNLKTYFTDIRDSKAVENIIMNKDMIFNLAGQLGHLESMENPHNDLTINVNGQLNILESCRKFNPNVRILFSSTRQIYGKPHYLPVDENHPITPIDVNGINKYAAENYHLLYQKIYGIKSVILRITNTYGPRIRIKDAKQTFIGIWLRSLIENKAIPIYGDGSQTRDLTFIDDLIDAMLLAIKSDEAFGNIFNISGDKVTLLELAQTIQSIRPHCKYEFISFPASRKIIDIGDYFANDSKINQLLGWKRKVSLLDGLKNSIEYYEKNFDHYIGENLS